MSVMYFVIGTLGKGADRLEIRHFIHPFLDGDECKAFCSMQLTESCMVFVIVAAN
jgi:hypothetical protein